MEPRPWIVILNWNGLEETLDCLDSLAALPADRAEILVIDNGSVQDPTAEIAHRFPAVRVERLPRNLGFAGGCNVGIERALAAGAPAVLLLNNDTTVSPGFLDPLLARLEAEPTLGIVAPLICESDAPDRIWYAGATIDLARGSVEHRLLGAARGEAPATPYETGFATGCCMLLSATLLREVGPFDERFFAYYEDADLSLRARHAGFGIACVPESVILHKESASTRKGLQAGSTSPLKHFLMTRNRITLVRKHGSPAERLAFLTLVLPAVTLYYLAAFTLRRRWEKMAWFMRGLRHGLQQTFDNPT